MVFFSLTSILVCALALLSGRVNGITTRHNRDYFYVGGEYVAGPVFGNIKFGQMYVEHLKPLVVLPNSNPLVFIHGAGLTGSTWLDTPDDREGWAEFFLKRGYEIYIVDQPARGRSAYQPGHDGPQFMFPAELVEGVFTAPTTASWSFADRHTQWPGTGLRGDPTFEEFYSSLVPLVSTDSESGLLNQNALIALLSSPKIQKDVILVTHSQSGLFGWPAADAAVAQNLPRKVKAIVALEPGGPPFQPDTQNQPTTPNPALIQMHPWGLSEVPMTYDPAVSDPSEFTLEPIADDPGYTCVQQSGTPRKWANLLNLPVLVVTAEASWHASFDDCTVNFMCQAGLTVHFARLPDFGILGNGHMLYLEKNNKKIAQDVVLPFIQKVSFNWGTLDSGKFKVCPGLSTVS
ncbi:hypothetical protein HGRIS_003132 [Hohenbuehelia grisea]|uniref:AB hydrolase-1 domain-containing protein n=1 Tax=Hohenbuehelia grisea TaxID=104357 RepID=A0ABR3JMT3_9AGAR